jgi:hypothetical protein
MRFDIQQRRFSVAFEGLLFLFSFLAKTADADLLPTGSDAATTDVCSSRLSVDNYVMSSVTASMNVAPKTMTSSCRRMWEDTVADSNSDAARRRMNAMRVATPADEKRHRESFEQLPAANHSSFFAANGAPTTAPGSLSFATALSLGASDNDAPEVVERATAGCAGVESTRPGLPTLKPADVGAEVVGHEKPPNERRIHDTGDVGGGGASCRPDAELPFGDKAAAAYVSQHKRFAFASAS